MLLRRGYEGDQDALIDWYQEYLMLTIIFMWHAKCLNYS